jgi:hypothetical protein
MRNNTRSEKKPWEEENGSGEHDQTNHHMLGEDGELLFDKEVDFHHQIAYSFEKAARFKANNKPEAIVHAANKEIMKLIETQSWIIDIDPMIIFYSFYFSVFYQNYPLLEYLQKYVIKRNLTKMGDRNQSPGKKSKGVSEAIRELQSTTTIQSNYQTNKFAQTLDREKQIEKIDRLLEMIYK